MWSTLGHTPLIDDSFFQDDTFHWGMATLLDPLHWGIVISESTFIGDTVILLDILH